MKFALAVFFGILYADQILSSSFFSFDFLSIENCQRILPFFWVEWNSELTFTHKSVNSVQSMTPMENGPYEVPAMMAVMYNTDFRCGRARPSCSFVKALWFISHFTFPLFHLVITLVIAAIQVLQIRIDLVSYHFTVSSSEALLFGRIFGQDTITSDAV